MSFYTKSQQEMLDDLKTQFQVTALYTGIQEPSDRILQVIKKIKRHLFVSKKYKHLAYKNIPLPIANNQTISQPFIVALMTELLDLEPQDNVLEIGTGSGYQTAILAMLAKQVYTIEIIENLFHTAKQKFKRLNIKNIYSLQGNGINGCLEYATFNKIIVTANIKQILSSLINQLSTNGIIIAPVGDDYKQQFLYKIIKTIDHRIIKKSILPVSFVPFIY